ncbi:MAG: YgiT-type zinc finger protein [Anaerolineae bacterium]|nr:YgiT-type zinc finger protein [Anaerolineae bacterium]
MMSESPCEYCDSEDGLEEKLVTVYRQRKGQHFIFERVPARVCKACGHKYFTWEVVAEMDRLLNAPETQARVQPVPVVAIT